MVKLIGKAAVLAVVFFGIGLLAGQKLKKGGEVSGPGYLTQNWENEIMLASPRKGLMMESPAAIEGKIKRSWTFEAVFSAWILDNKKEVIGGGPVYTTSTNETDEWVNFKANFTFETKSNSGFVLIKNDNPSGLPENEKQVEIPVKFEQ